MKTLVFLALVSLTAALRAADPVVIVTSPMSVTINGTPAGTVVDALANNPNLPNLRARLLDAWLAYEKKFQSDLAARGDAMTEAAAASIKKAGDDTQARAQTAIAAFEQKTNDADAKRAAADVARVAAEKRLMSLVVGLDGVPNLPSFVKSDIAAAKAAAKTNGP